MTFLRKWLGPIVLLSAVGLLLALGPRGPRDHRQGLRVGHFANVTHAQALVGRATGDFELALGQPVAWTHFAAGPAVIEALFSGELDAAYVGPNPAINGFIRSKGQALVVVAGAAEGGSALVVAPHANINQPADFRGKAIATPQLGNTQDVAARVWLARNGLRTVDKGGDVTIHPLFVADHLQLFRSKQIDASWVVEPWVTRLERECGGRVLIDEATLWPDGRYPTTMLIVSRRLWDEQPATVRKLIEAHIAVTQRINADKAWAAGIVDDELSRVTGSRVPAGITARAMQRVKFTWRPLPDALLKAAEDAHQIGFLRDRPNLDGIVNDSVLNEVVKEQRITDR